MEDADKNDIALVTDVGTIDDKSFNQGAWEGVVAYANENNLVENTDYKYYQPTEKSDVAYVEAINQAIQNGATTVVTPGFLFEVAIYAHQSVCTDVNYILLDGVPQVGDYTTFEVGANTYSILYAEHESGFFAGYAAVKEGYTKLGFMGGMAVPAVVKFGHGFVQGAEAAAVEMGVDVEIKYNYLGGFGPDATYQTKAAGWYSTGTEVIFAAAGGAGLSVMTAAEENSGMVIGVDIDQKGDSTTVITSALKELSTSVKGALDVIYAKTGAQTDVYKAGESISLTAANDGVGLSADFSRFSTFVEADYTAIFDKVVAGTVTVDANVPGDGEEAANLEAYGTKVTVSVIE
jgi:basic membrane protein A